MAHELRILDKEGYIHTLIFYTMAHALRILDKEGYIHTLIFYNYCFSTAKMISPTCFNFTSVLVMIYKHDVSHYFFHWHTVKVDVCLADCISVTSASVHYNLGNL
jgi:hypothetical protein